MNECICVDILYKLKLPMTSCFQSIFFPTQLSSFSNRHIFSMLRHQQNNQSSSAANLMKAYHAPALGVGCSSANHYQRTSTVSFSFPQLTSFPLPGSPPPPLSFSSRFSFWQHLFFLCSPSLSPNRFILQPAPIVYRISSDNVS
jgi:hypothetical protein